MKLVSRLIFVLLLGTAVSLVDVAHAKRPADNKILGVHRLKILGDFNGVGKATVSPNAVKFELKLKDDKGANCDGDSDDIEFGDGRFWGTIETGAISIEISGRVDIPEAGKSPRVTGFLRTTDGRVARIANSVKTADSDKDNEPDHVEDDHNRAQRRVIKSSGTITPPKRR